MNSPHNDDKIRGYIGIAQKAGKVVAGGTMVLEALKRKDVALVIIAEDAAESVNEEIQKACGTVTVIRWQTKAELGLYTGKSPRGAIAILDKGFAKAILEQVEDI